MQSRARGRARACRVSCCVMSLPCSLAFEAGEETKLKLGLRRAPDAAGADAGSGRVWSTRAGARIG